MEKDIDLSGVDPARWPEIRRRAALLDEFVGLTDRPVGLRQEYADRMGMSLSHFMQVVKIWRGGRSAAAIPGARSKVGVAKRRRLPARTVEMVQGTIRDLGPMARRVAVIAEVGRRAEAMGIDRPSNTMVTKLLSEARADMTGPADFEPEILIDECSLKLPVVSGESVIMPRVLMAVRLPEREILDVEVSFDPDVAPSAEILAERLTTGMDAAARELPMRAPHLEPAIGMAIGAETGPRTGAPTLNRVLGTKVGDIGVVYQLSKVRASDSLLSARHSRGIGTIDSIDAIRRAVAAHNDKVAGRADAEA